MICGDIKQLPAIISSEKARDLALEVSLMERLQDRPIYDLKGQKAKQAVQPEYNNENIIRLVDNYRSHPGILLVSSTLFYDDVLEPVANVPASRWDGLPNKRIPILIKGVESDEDWIDEVS